LRWAKGFQREFLPYKFEGFLPSLLLFVLDCPLLGTFFFFPCGFSLLHFHVLRSGLCKGGMDVLLENVPQLVPSEKKVQDWFGFDGEEPNLWKAVGDGGMLLGSGAAFGGCGKMVLTFRKEQVTFPEACSEVVRTVLSSLDNTSTMLRPALLPTLKGQAAEFHLDLTNRQEDSATARRMRWLTKTLKLLSTHVEPHNEVLLRFERLTTGSSERIDQQLWPLFLKNRAKLDAFRVGHTDDRYLESRKIFLPQGATLILRQWQSELNEFVNDLEEVSSCSGAWLETGCC
jgi:hypothetical protein